MRSNDDNADRVKVGDHVTIFKRGRRWWGEFYLDGRQQRRSLKTASKKQAQTLAIQIDAQLTAGAYATPTKAWTVGEAIEAYLTHLQTEDRAASTLKRYRPEMARFREFAKRLGVTRLSGVTVALVDQFRAERVGKVAASTLYHETVLVKQLMNFACSRGGVKTNVLKSLKINKPNRRTRPVFTLAQVDKILDVTPEPERSMFAVLAFSGMRVGELKYLSWDDVDLDGGWLHVRAKPDVGWRPKGKEDRKIFINNRLRHVLEGLRRVGHWVFWQKYTRRGVTEVRQVDERRLLKQLKAVLKKTGIPAGTLHTFRHTYITVSSDRGTPPFHLMGYVGHKDLKTTLGYYHATDGPLQRAMGAVTFDIDMTTDGADSKQGQIEDSNDEEEAA